MNPDARSKLILFIATYGKNVIDNPARCQALLRDHFENRHYEEERALLLILHRGLLTGLNIHSPRQGKAALWLTHSQSLAADLHLHQSPPPLALPDLLWALDSWALALGILTLDQLPQRIQPAQVAPKPVPPPRPRPAVTPSPYTQPRPPRPPQPVQQHPQSSHAPPHNQSFWFPAKWSPLVYLVIVGASLTGIIRQCTPAPAPQPAQITDSLNPQDLIGRHTTYAPRPAALPKWTNTIGMPLVLLPAGSFTMGTHATEPDRLNEGVAQNATIDHQFWIGATEVTRAQWKDIMGRLPADLTDQPDSDKLPVENVSWVDAMAFCRKLSDKEGVTYDLPTQTMWEYACRAGTSTRFNWGTVPEPQKYANFASSGPLPVASFPPNNWGLYDMHGNVAEWCKDGNLSTQSINLRGGSWRFPLNQTRAAYLDQRHYITQEPGIGFRVIRIASENQPPPARP